MRATTEQIEEARTRCPKPDRGLAYRVWEVPLMPEPKLVHAKGYDASPDTVSVKVIRFQLCWVLQNDGPQWCWGYVGESP